MSATTTPVSDRKLNANRQNAQKSTGPRTPEGKHRSSKNATTHGLYASTLLLPGESEACYHGLRHLLLDSMNPQDALELLFAEQVVTAAWRLNRLNDADLYNHHMESERLQAEHEQFVRDHPDSQPRTDRDDSPPYSPGLARGSHAPQEPTPGAANSANHTTATATTTADADADAEFPPLSPGFVIAASLRRALDGDTPGASRTTPFERLLNAQHRLMSHVYRAMKELRTLQAARRSDERQAGIPHDPTCPFVPEDAYDHYAELGRQLEEEQEDDDDDGDGDGDDHDLNVAGEPPPQRNPAQHGATTPPPAAQNEPTTRAAKLRQACENALPTIPNFTPGAKT